MAKKIMIVDDEKDMRIYLTTLFRKAGYETEEAENGEEGLEKVKTFKPDLVTLDLLMPKRTGVKCFHSLRNDPETKDIPIIVLTGLPQHQDLFGNDFTGPDKPAAIVEKPIEPEAFLKKVQEIIGV